MSKIAIGDMPNGKPLKLDLDLLIPSRLLIQANSGGGKSWLLRRLAEQFCGHVQTIIIDPEGEFFTLREKFPYVLVGEGGETPCDLRSASMLAERFLTLHASAICDLFEAFRGKPMAMRKWVSIFINSLLEAPRSLWHPLVVIVDEAHKFCPQENPKAGSQQDREIIGSCKDAMIALSTTGRKRGFCPIWATQRLAKVDKDASAEFFNRLVGMTIEDVDVKRAAELMSVSGKDEVKEFHQSLRQLTPGQFYAFGRAISTERVLVTVGEVQTKHPESGKAAKAQAVPPTPEEVAKLLPQLADLPKEAETKARTVAELEKQVRDLTRELKKRPADVAPAVVADEKAIERAVKAATSPLLKQIEQIRRQAKQTVENFAKAAAPLNAIANMLPQQEVPVPLAWRANPADVMPGTRHQPTIPPRIPRPAPAPTNGDGTLSSAQIRVLSRLIELIECTGQPNVRKEQLAAWAEYSPNSGGFNNYLGSLRSAGMIDYPAPGMVTITDAGRAVAQPESIPADSTEMLSRASRVLGGSEAKLLALLHNRRDPMSKTELAEQSGFSPNSGGFNNYLGHMRTLGFVEYPAPGHVRAADWLYL